MMMKMMIIGRMPMDTHWEDDDWVDKYKEYNKEDTDIWNNNNDDCENANDDDEDWRLMIEGILIASRTRGITIEMIV